MNIIYPPLVEEGIKLQLSERKHELLNKAEMYRLMVDRGVISENGEPTDYAIDQGLVKEYTEPSNMSLEEFLGLYPIFERYDLQLLQKIDGFWEIPVSLKELLLQSMAENKFNYDECVQVMEYLADR
ncbi:hypothetical protein JZO86_14175 [Enterococcus ureasiticus]|uniref:hypothetical protein n=1 Tax=Enterococcus ureasiticus TaxID=903984 RepID=UPI001A903224|nr:hypothetical protein [Enterococcus ureasiticus]MBO0474845.1 hypothetical protein [Enterococcus ureasiticus]